MSRSIKGKAAVIGVGESDYYRHGHAPKREFELTVDAILNAANDAGISPKSIDGFVSFADDRNTPTRLANALGIDELRWSTMQWGGGGAGGSGAVQQAAAAIAAGFAETVVVYRGLNQGEFGRYGAGRSRRANDSLRVAYGMLSPAQLFAPKMMRFLYETGIDPAVQEAVSLASYHHARTNPRAVMHDHKLTPERYRESRWIVEPWRLYDCCQENDGAAALILSSPERARELSDRPVYVMAAAQGAAHRAGGFLDYIYDGPDQPTSEFKTTAPRLFEMAGIGPADVDVVQAYENFTGGVVMSLIEHGFSSVEEADSFFRLENLIAPSGRLPLNTSGGNIAEAYIHGLELNVEAVRQIRATATNQVPDAQVSFVASGPMVTPVTSVIFCSEEALA